MRRAALCYLVDCAEHHPLPRVLQDHRRRLLADHDRRRVGVAGDNRRHDRGVHRPQTLSRGARIDDRAPRFIDSPAATGFSSLEADGATPRCSYYERGRSPKRARAPARSPQPYRLAHPSPPTIHTGIDQGCPGGTGRSPPTPNVRRFETWNHPIEVENASGSGRFPRGGRQAIPDRGDTWRGSIPGKLWPGGFNDRAAWTWISTTHPFPRLQACRCRAVGGAPSMPSSAPPVSSPRRRPPRPRTELDKHRPRPRCP